MVLTDSMQIVKSFTTKLLKVLRISAVAQMKLIFTIQVLILKEISEMLNTSMYLRFVLVISVLAVARRQSVLAEVLR